MITVISGTNRKGSECLYFAKKYAELLGHHTQDEIKVLAMEDIPHDWFFANMYDKNGMAESLRRIQDEYMIPAEKFVYVNSEYNGSFPGAIKLFLDAISVREIKPTFKYKKAALVGIASGRAGNLRGMEHLTGVLHHLQMIVMPGKLPISSIDKLLNEQRELSDEKTLTTMSKHAAEFVAF